jgi:hypothetical protein
LFTYFLAEQNRGKFLVAAATDKNHFRNNLPLIRKITFNQNNNNNEKRFIQHSPSPTFSIRSRFRFDVGACNVAARAVVTFLRRSTTDSI